ncbi:MAG TPA: PxKF domain-containing protein, partial [Gemmatimonadales bacterium]|nr:PxKF domain-containing protein [Gemmatimonadales bacterium]
TSGVFTQVGAGGTHACAVRDDGVVECWGENFAGQAPLTRSALSGAFTQVSAGNHSQHSCAVRTDGVVECWGDNTSGAAPPTRTALAGSFTQVEAGDHHTCALRNDGVVECWGTGPEAPASKSAANGSFTQVSAGTSHTCALRSDGVAECWGLNNLGQAPATRSASSGAFTEVSAGVDYTCARRTDGVVECWGRNSFGEAPALRFSGHEPPAAFFTAPSSALLGVPFTLELFGAWIPNHPDAITSFTYAFDCGGGYGTFGSSTSAQCTANSTGARTVKGTVRDQDGDQTEYTAGVTVVVGYTFIGFFAPVDNDGILNVAKAGKTVPLKWRLVDVNGNPVATLASVQATVSTLVCDLGPTADAVEEYTANQSGLQNLGDGYYQFNWKTPASYAKSCKTLTLDLGDGTPRTALFQFTK